MTYSPETAAPALEKVVLIASSADPTAEYLFGQCRARRCGIDFFELETISSASTQRLIEQLSEVYPPRSVYLRTSDVPDPAAANSLTRLLDFLHHYEGRVVNRPSRLSLNESKPLQMASIAAHSTQTVRPIPTRLRSGPPSAFEAGHLITKSVSSVRSRVVVANNLDLLKSGVRCDTPVQTQPLLAGVPLRVHTVDADIVAVSALASSTDYRYSGDLELIPAELPKEVAVWCVEAALREGLVLAGIDLILSEATGQYFCLEINPSPAYHHFEQLPDFANYGTPVTDYLLQYLLGNRSSARQSASCEAEGAAP